MGADVVVKYEMTVVVNWSCDCCEVEWEPKPVDLYTHQGRTWLMALHRNLSLELPLSAAHQYRSEWGPKLTDDMVHVGFHCCITYRSRTLVGTEQVGPGGRSVDKVLSRNSTGGAAPRNALKRWGLVVRICTQPESC